MIAHCHRYISVMYFHSLLPKEAGAGLASSASQSSHLTYTSAERPLTQHHSATHTTCLDHHGARDACCTQRIIDGGDDSRQSTRSDKCTGHATLFFDINAHCTVLSGMGMLAIIQAMRQAGNCSSGAASVHTGPAATSRELDVHRRLSDPRLRLVVRTGPGSRRDMYRSGWRQASGRDLGKQPAMVPTGVVLLTGIVKS